MNKENIINNMIEYLAELWGNLSVDEWNYNWLEIIGLNEKQMQEYELTKTDEE